MLEPENDKRKPIRLAVLISGGGTTLVNLAEKIRQGILNAEISTVISSRRDVAGPDRAAKLGLPVHVIRRRDVATDAEFSRRIFDACEQAAVDLVILAGFLSPLQVPKNFERRVLNIHPSLIPAFCGHGFYGSAVHTAVLARGAKISGCTVHYVDNEYDHGPIIAQAAVPVLSTDTPDTLAARVFQAECQLYPMVIAAIGDGRIGWTPDGRCYIKTADGDTQPPGF